MQKPHWFSFKSRKEGRNSLLFPPPSILSAPQTHYILLTLFTVNLFEIIAKNLSRSWGIIYWYLKWCRDPSSITWWYSSPVVFNLFHSHKWMRSHNSGFMNPLGHHHKIEEHWRTSQCLIILYLVVLSTTLPGTNILSWPACNFLDPSLYYLSNISVTLAFFQFSGIEWQATYFC